MTAGAPTRGTAARRAFRAAAVLALAALVLGWPAPAFSGKSKGKGGAARGRKKPATAAPAHCRAAAAVDSDLAAGLELHLAGKAAEAIPRLSAWAGKPEAEKDPAAGRGFYSLAFALRARGQVEKAQAASDRARTALAATLAASATLESYYYLASLHESRRDAAAQLTTTAEGLRAFDEGKLCPKPDGDDLFRASRLAGFAGRLEQQADLLARAAQAYAAGRGTLLVYRALVHAELAQAARRAGDVAAWESGLRAAAAVDSTIPGVHRGIGLALIEKGDIAGAADYWRANWRNERDNGNGLVYCIPVLDDLVRHRAAFGEAERVADLADHTMPALEQNAELEARRFMELEAERAAAEAGTFPPARELERARAEYRMSQFLFEYMRRGGDIQELALEKGLLPAIHHRSLPTGRR